MLCVCVSVVGVFAEVCELSATELMVTEFHNNINRHVIDANTRMLLPTANDINFAQDVVCTAPGNDIVKALIEEQSKIRLHGGPGQTPLERKAGWVRSSGVMSMGPSLYFSILSKQIFGRELRGDFDVIAARRAIRQQWPLLITKKEMWCDGLVISPYDACSRSVRLSNE